MNMFNIVHVLFLNYDRVTIPIKISVKIVNNVRAEMELDTRFGISAVSVKCFRRMFSNYKIFLSDVLLKTTSRERNN